MKEYIATKTSGKYIEFDSATNTSKVVVKSELEQQVQNWIDEVEKLPELTDEFLLEWARANYPMGTQKEVLTSLITEAQETLGKLK